jgi:Ca2+/Na+ antiporter
MPNEELLEMLIPITLFVVTFLVVWVVVLFRYRAKREIQATYRAAIEQGQELTPELLERLGETQPKNRDLRRGVISLCIGLAFVIFALVLGEQDAVRPMIAVGMFPMLLGAAYLGLWTFSGKDS